MKSGDLVEFKCIVEGEIDRWKKGLIVKQGEYNRLFSGKIKFSYVLCKGRIFRTLPENCRVIGEG